MTPERLEIARRFVACPKWVWIDGVLIAGRSGRTVFGRMRRGLAVPDGCIPDLDDDITRLGLLAVARRAWGDEYSCVRPFARFPLPTVWEWEAGIGIKRQIGYAMTEEAALLAALEAAQ